MTVGRPSSRRGMKLGAGLLACAALVVAGAAVASPTGTPLASPPTIAGNPVSPAASPGLADSPSASLVPSRPAVLLAAAKDDVPGVPGLAVGTRLHLMLLNEVTSRTAHAGDRFKLRVNEAVVTDGKTIVPVGATAWGEIKSLQANGSVGKSGRLGAELLYLELPSGRVPLEGSIARKGESGGGQVAMAIVGFGILGLLAQGDSARLRAGDIFIGTVARAPAAESVPLPTPASPVVPVPAAVTPPAAMP